MDDVVSPSPANPAPPQRLDAHASAAEDALTALVALLRPDLEACNRTIVARMDSPVALIPQLAAHIVAAGGKRFRPLLTLAAARLCGYAGERHVKLAACVEFIHTATLLHDDVVDESLLRRGLASANAVFGNKASVLVGDFLFARAFQLMVEDGSLGVLGILSRPPRRSPRARCCSLSPRTTCPRPSALPGGDQGQDRRAVRRRLRGGRRGGRSARGRGAALAEFGLNLGIAFQLVDDALDYAADQAMLGKTVGDDFREGKITLPVLVAFQAGDAADRDFWRRTIEATEQNDADLDRALHLMRHCDAIRTTLRRARVLPGGEGGAGRFPDSPLRRRMLDVADFTVSRAIG